MEYGNQKNSSTGWDVKNAFSQIAATEIFLECIHYEYVVATAATEKTLVHEVCFTQ